jgi:hypothetical protein
MLIYNQFISIYIVVFAIYTYFHCNYRFEEKKKETEKKGCVMTCNTCLLLRYFYYLYWENYYCQILFFFFFSAYTPTNHHCVSTFTITLKFICIFKHPTANKYPPTLVDTYLYNFNLSLQRKTQISLI